jgi:hypothetical protein
MGLTNEITPASDLKNIGILKDGYVTSYGWWNNETSDWDPGSLVDANQRPYNEINNYAMNRIVEHIRYFVANPTFAVKFFTMKYISQWSSVNFSGFAYFVFEDDSNPPTAIASEILYGFSYKVLQFFMSGYKLLIGIFAFFALWHYRKTKKIDIFLLPLIILGGTLFHQISEGKDDYVIPYFVMMIPYASYGIMIFMKFLHKKFKFLS